MGIEIEVAISDTELEGSLDRLIFISKLIKVGVNANILEGEVILFDSVFDTYKKLELTHSIKQKYIYSIVFHALKSVRNYFVDNFIEKEIEETVEDLMEMYELYKSKDPYLKENQINKYDATLDRFRMFIQSRLINRQYEIVLPELEKARTELIEQKELKL